MKKIKVLFFAADPTSVLPNKPQPLQLGADFRGIRKRVEEDGRLSVMDFDCQFDARPEDLVDRLRLTRPQILHFSGHGDVQGLMFSSPRGDGPQMVTGAALKQMLTVIRHDIRLVVLSACFSKEQAAAIAEVVGCAIGTSGGIADEDAIRFDAAFYGYLARGESVQSAFNMASAELGVHGVSGTRPELLARKDVNPAKLFPMPRYRRQKQGTAAAAFLVLSTAIVASIPEINRPEPYIPAGFRVMGCVAPAVSGQPASTIGSATYAGSSAVAELEEAKALCTAGAADSAFHLFEKLAQAGNAEAQGLEAIALMTGRGAHHDPQLGVEKLRNAAGKGDLRSMTALAIAYQTGFGVRGSQYYARYWLGKAARRGDAEAMRRLGVVHRQAKNDSALYWLKRAVAAGSGDALVDLGYMYDAGILVARDTTKAVQQYVAAARAGSPRGMYAVGAVYQAGMGVKKDPVQAHRWFYRAACVGSPDAMAAIGEQFLHGNGVPADSGMAKRWLRLASAAGSPSAAGKLHALKTPEQPRQWRGPVGWLLARFGRAGPHPQLSCSSGVGTGPA